MIAISSLLEESSNVLDYHTTNYVHMIQQKKEDHEGEFL